MYTTYGTVYILEAEMKFLAQFPPSLSLWHLFATSISEFLHENWHSLGKFRLLSLKKREKATRAKIRSLRAHLDYVTQPCVILSDNLITF